MALFTVGPACDYQDCHRHSVQTNRSLNRKIYCTADCRDNERKRRQSELRTNVQARLQVINQMVEQHKLDIAKRANRNDPT